MTAAILGAVWWMALALCAAAVAYRLFALAAVAWWRPIEGHGWTAPPRVTVLKPLCGVEDGLEEALASFLAQRTTSPVRFVFGVARADDPALALARDVAARHPECAVEFVIDSERHGPNLKVGNLANMAKSGLDEVVVVSDSDVVIAPGVLQDAIDALSAPGIGGVTSLYRGRPGIAGNRTRSFGAWYVDYWSLPMQTLRARLGGLNVIYGPLTVVRGDILAKGGGFAALAPHLCDDDALGRLVLASGAKLGFAPHVVETLVNDATPGELFARELRWSRGGRGEHPIGNLALVVSHPGPLPLLLLIHPGWIAAAGILLPLVLRCLLAWVVEKRFGRAETCRRMGPIGAWLRDLVSFAVWANGLASNRVEWRGQQFTVAPGSMLEPSRPSLEQGP